MKRVLLATIIFALGTVLAGLVVGYVWYPSAGREPVVINGTAVPPVPTLDAAQVDAGRLLYGQYCASCHGANLEGQPNWRVPLASGLYPAPPHDDSGHTWHHADDLLMQIVREGGTRNSTAMPGFGAQLSNTEIQSILTYIKSTWGRDEREFQWWVTATQE